MYDLINRAKLRRKVQKVAVEAWKLKMTAQVETVMNQFLDFLEQSPAVNAVPLEPLCEFLAKYSICIPCEVCKYYANNRCTVMGDYTKHCPNSADDWRKAITKWMEGLDDD